MRFSTAYSRPTLTPLGQRLLNLSERKLYDLDAPIGARESGSALLCSVLIRETVRSAWAAVDEGHQAVLNDWSSPTALGLDVIGEDEEEEADEEDVEKFSEAKEDQWFEDLLSELGEKDVEGGWVVGVRSAYPRMTKPVVSTINTVLPLLEVDDNIEASITSRLGAPHTSVEMVDTEAEARAELSGPDTSLSTVEYSPYTFDTNSPPPSIPITPIDQSFNMDLPSLEYMDQYDPLSLPPAMNRSWSSDSGSSSIMEDECLTPKLSCEDLEDVGGYEWDSEDDLEQDVGYEFASKFDSGYRGMRFGQAVGFRGC